MQYNIRLVAIGSFLSFATCAFYCMYAAAIHLPVQDDLVDRWLEIAFERKHLAGLDSTGVLITSEEYQDELAELSAREQIIVSDHEFPSDKSKLHSFLLSRATGNWHSIGFWLLLVTSGTTFAVALAWLHGHSTCNSNTNLELQTIADDA